MRERKIGIVAGPVDDYKLRESWIEQKAPPALISLQRAAYNARLQACGFRPDSQPPIETLKNKLTFRNDSIALSQSHTQVDHFEETSLALTYKVHGNGSENHHLHLPSSREGIHLLFDRPPRTAEEVRDTLCERTIGGNTSNLALSSLRISEALKDIDPLELDVIVPPDNALEQLLQEEREQLRGTLNIHYADTVKPRWGIHINHEILHTPKPALQTFMLNSQGTPKEVINEQLWQYRQLLEECSTVFAADDYAGLSGLPAHVLPTSSAISDLRFRPGQTLLINENECLQLLEANGRPSQQNGSGVLPSCIGPEGSTSPNLPTTNHQIRQLAEPLLQNENVQRRLAQIGKSDRHVLDIYQNGHDIIALETAPCTREAEKEYITSLESDLVRPEIEDGVGRGDASSAASLLDHVSPERLEQYWKNLHPGLHLELTPVQRAAAKLIVPTIASRMHATCIHHSRESNLYTSLSTAQYQKLLNAYLRCAYEMSAQVTRPPDAKPQLLRDSVYGYKTAIWKV